MRFISENTAKLLTEYMQSTIASTPKSLMTKSDGTFPDTDDEAYQMIKEKAESGDAEASLALANLTCYGLGTLID